MSDDGGGDDVMCCPLSNDGDGPSCCTTSTPKARKEHRCAECREPIMAGSRYEKVFGVWDGRAETFKTCLLCAEIRDHFACDGGWIYGELWTQLGENFFQEMKCGGQCMVGLSPAAKSKVIDERMEWYLTEDEIDDSAWRDWATRKPTTSA